MCKQEILLSEHLAETLGKALDKCAYDKLFVLTDEHTHELCLPLVDTCLPAGRELITIAPGDCHKNLETLAYVWNELSNRKGTRRSLMLNLGGGMVTDLGGFAAATFKRGITYINIPTTLLAMVDASAGGKTGINFNGLKNEIGAFSPARFVLLDTEFLRSLDDENIRSGYAEMLKHGLISDTEHWAELLNFDPARPDYDALRSLVSRSVSIKERIVEQDPREKGIRKALNFGHTAGHAFESLALEQGRPRLHGYAVAWGIVCELYLSCLRTGFPKDKLRQTVQFIKETYSTFDFDCKQYDRLYEFMTHDKKNESDAVNFTLLADVGDIRINQTAGREEIFEMLDFYREAM